MGTRSADDPAEDLDRDEKDDRREIEKTATKAKWRYHPANRRDQGEDEPIEATGQPPQWMVTRGWDPGEDHPREHRVEEDLKRGDQEIGNH